MEELLKEIESSKEPRSVLLEKTKRKLKLHYDRCKVQQLFKPAKSNALPELIIQNFDSEQIYQQVELQNEEILTRYLTTVSRLLVNKDRLLFENPQEELPKEDKENEEDAGMSASDEEADFSSEEKVKSGVSALEESDSEDISEEEENETDFIGETSKKHKSSVVDDEFFKLNEMEDFLKSEEKKLEEPDSGNDNNSEEEDDSKAESEEIDLFKANDSDSDDQDGRSRTAKYKDFFGKQDEKPTTAKRNKFMEEQDFSGGDNSGEDDEQENMELDENETANVEKNPEKSMFELRQERISKKISHLEKEAVSEKPWTLKGEITAEGRPVNSLLEENVEFDMIRRPAPIMTEQTSRNLEDIVKQRIKDRLWDDVERKLKPVETPLEFKKKLVLDQEKSKHSLAQIYEDEYLKQQQAEMSKGTSSTQYEKDAEEPPELHKEIDKMMSELFHKMDALSNFHFTPTVVAPELKIVTNMPAIAMEEVAPVAVSDAQLLAPEEVKAKPKGGVIGESEQSKTDKNRARRKKKQKQKIHKKLKEKKEALQGNKITALKKPKHNKMKIKFGQTK